MTATTSLPGTARAPQTAGASNPGLMADVLAGTIDPGRVDDETDLDHVGDAYVAMDDRRAIRLLVRVRSL